MLKKMNSRQLKGLLSNNEDIFFVSNVKKYVMLRGMVK